MRHHTSFLLAAGVCVIGIGGCSADAVSPPSLGSVVLASGDAQSGTPGLPLPDTLVARILSVTGRPMSGVAVSWRVTYGAGTLTPFTDTSDANGNIRAILTLGPAPGTTLVVAAVADLPGVTFTETGRGLQATELAVGLNEACAVDLQARTWCWGWIPTRGDSGQRTNREFADSGFVPTLVAGGHAFIELAAGMDHVCGLLSAGAVWCWGMDGHGQLGSGAVGGVNDYVSYPIPLLNAPAFAHIFSGDGNTTCGLTADSAAWCWGENEYGQVGSGSSIDPISDPQPVAGGLKFVSLSPTQYHTCGIAVGGAAYCWGLNSGVLLGDSGASGPSSNVPVAVAGGHLFRSLYTTDAYNCGTTADLGPVCWGLLPYGAPPQGVPAAAPYLTPLTTYRPGGWRGVAFGIYGKQAVDVFTDGMRDEGTPVPLHALTTGFWVACALAQDGTVYCWGVNDSGQTGNPYSFGYDGGWSEVHAVTVPPNY